MLGRLRRFVTGGFARDGDEEGDRDNGGVLDTETLLTLLLRLRSLGGALQQDQGGPPVPAVHEQVVAAAEETAGSCVGRVLRDSLTVERAGDPVGGRTFRCLVDSFSDRTVVSLLTSAGGAVLCSRARIGVGDGLAFVSQEPLPEGLGEVVVSLRVDGETAGAGAGAGAGGLVVREERVYATLPGNGDGVGDCTVTKVTVRTGDGREWAVEEFYAGGTCSVCFEATPDTACLPCRHLCLCGACAELLRNSTPLCPLCRSTTQALVRIVSRTRSPGPPAGLRNSQAQSPTGQGQSVQ